MGAALLFGQKTAGFTEKSALKNWPTIWPDGLMSYTSPARPAGRPGSSTGVLLGFAQNKGRSTEKSSLNATPTISRRELISRTERAAKKRHCMVYGKTDATPACERLWFVLVSVVVLRCVLRCQVK